MYATSRIVACKKKSKILTTTTTPGDTLPAVVPGLLTIATGPRVWLQYNNSYNGNTIVTIIMMIIEYYEALAYVMKREIFVKKKNRCRAVGDGEKTPDAP